MAAFSVGVENRYFSPPGRKPSNGTVRIPRFREKFSINDDGPHTRKRPHSVGAEWTAVAIAAF